MCRCGTDVTDKGMRNFFDCEIFKYREDDEFYKNYELMKFEKYSYKFSWKIFSFRPKSFKVFLLKVFNPF